MQDQAGKGRNFGRLRLDFHSLGDLQALREFLEEHVNIAIENGDQAEEEAVYACLGDAYLSYRDFRGAIEYYKKHLKIDRKSVV